MTAHDEGADPREHATPPPAHGDPPAHGVDPPARAEDAPSKIDDPLSLTVDEKAPETERATEVLAPKTPSRKKPSRGRLVALGLLVGIPAFIVGSLFAARGAIVRHVLVTRAAAMGIDLAVDDVGIHLGELELSGVRASLTGVHGVSVKIEHATVELHRLSIESIDVDGVSVSVEGSAIDRVLELVTWSKEHLPTLRLPARAKDLRLDWRARAGASSWLTVSGGSITDDGAKAELAGSAVTFGVPAGAIAASVAVNEAGVTIEAGRRAGEKPPITASFKTQTSPPSLEITLHPVDPTALSTALGVAAPAHTGGTISGQINLALGKTGSSGSFALDLDGWLPPHPHAIDPFLTNKKVAVRARIAMNEERSSANLDEVEVKVGRLSLKGTATLAEDEKAEPDGHKRATIRADLGGTLPCSELARNAAGKELPGILGDLFGEAAGRAVGGTAHVSVTIDADVRSLATAKVTPKVSVGCAVKLPL